MFCSNKKKSVLLLCPLWPFPKWKVRAISYPIYPDRTYNTTATYSALANLPGREKKWPEWTLICTFPANKLLYVHGRENIIDQRSWPTFACVYGPTHFFSVQRKLSLCTDTRYTYAKCAPPSPSSKACECCFVCFGINIMYTLTHSEVRMAVGCKKVAKVLRREGEKERERDGSQTGKRSSKKECKKGKI